MCGIYANYSVANKADVFREQTAEQLKHRGPDGVGSQVFLGDKLFFLHTRLNIIDLDRRSNQPFNSNDGNLTVIFNGEIYNYLELRNEIGSRYQWKTTSDTEVLIAAWSLWGEDCLSKLEGMFAFAIYDQKKAKVFLVRDRFGIKPLYISKDNFSWQIASEIAPLLNHKKQVLPNNSIIRTYLQTGVYDHSEQTFFQGIEAIKPGTYRSFCLKTAQWEEYVYYCLNSIVGDLQTPDHRMISSDLEYLLEETIKKHLRSDVSVGLNLSGGVDSTLIYSFLDQLSKSKFQCFNVKFPQYDEYEYASSVSGSAHLTPIEISPQKIIDCLEFTVSAQQQPFGGLFVCAYNYLYQKAKETGLSVILDGNGADEVFLGYEKYLKNLDPNSQLTVAIDGSENQTGSAMSPELYKFPLIGIPNGHDSAEQPRNIALSDLIHLKVPRSLRFNDHVSMAHSVELRVPFLDHKLVEFACAIPTNKLINDHSGKIILRQILSKRLGSTIAFAPKRSVQTPQREWMKSEFKDLLGDLLFSKRFSERGWVDPVKATKSFENFLKSDQPNSFHLWQWLNIEMWAREFIDK